MPIEAFAVTRQGTKNHDRGRPNEDAAACHPDDGLFAAVDGIGSLSYSDAAARITIEWLRKRCTGTPNGAIMMEAFSAARQEMRQHLARRVVRGEMGCCASALWLAEGHAVYEGVLGHGGDTSILVFANNALTQLTAPDTEEGNVTCWVGSAADVEPLVTRVSIPKGAWVLILTDGATKKVPDLEDWMRANAPAMNPQELAEALALLALTRGETDDITVVALRT